MRRRVAKLIAGHSPERGRFRRSARHISGAKYKIDFAFQQRERLLEIVTVRRRPTAGRYHHIDQAKPAGGIFAVMRIV